jgi:UDP-N-acetyl-D-glucosamine dehydrogenase
MKDALIARIGRREAVVGVVGMGYVGIPLMLTFARAGFRVVGFDIDRERVDQLNAGESYIAHLPSSEIAAMRNGKFEATTDFSRAASVDALIICVPTPLNRYREPDLSYVVTTIDSLAPHLRAGQFMALESTTYPGTTEEELRPRLEARGFHIGSDYFLAFSPEREDPGNARFSTQSIPKVCGGSTPGCLDVALALYGAAIDRVVPVSSTRCAEMVKLLENIHRSVNIGLVNEMKMIADRMNIDIFEVIDAAATKPFGFVPYFPGPGVGGHCIPIDPFYLTWKAREFGMHTRFIELAGEINHAMPNWVVAKTAAALNDNGLAVRGCKALVLGIAYKKNVDDWRESPAVEILQQLQAMGAQASYADPLIPRIEPRGSAPLSAVALTVDLLRATDVVVIATDHDAFDYDLIAANARLVVDTRGRYRDRRANVVRA